MKKILELKMDNGESIFVEVDGGHEAESMRGIAENDRGLNNVINKLEDSLQPLQTFTKQIINKIKDLVDTPDETTIELGLKFSAKVGIIITTVDSEANLKISFKWKKI